MHGRLVTWSADRNVAHTSVNKEHLIQDPLLCLQLSDNAPPRLASANASAVGCSSSVAMPAHNDQDEGQATFPASADHIRCHLKLVPLQKSIIIVVGQKMTVHTVPLG